MVGRVFGRTIRAALAVVAALVVVSASTPLRAEDPYNIETILSLTGPLAFAGKDEADVLGVLEKSTNKSGGIRGRQIHFAVHDDQSNPVVALQLANELIGKNAQLILGPADAGTCNSIVPVIASGPVVYCFAPTVHPPDGSYMFSSSISAADIISTDLRYMRLRGWTKIALAVTTNAAGQDGERGVDEALALPENKGTLTLVDREHYNPTDISVAAQISHIQASGAQAVLVFTVGSPLGTFLKAAFQGGLAIPIFTTAANYNFRQLASYESFPPANLYMALAAYAAPESLPRGPVKTVVRAYLDGLKAANIPPSQPQIAAWDPGQITLAALRALGTNATSAQIRSYIANLTGWVGIDGTYDFHKIPQRGVGGDYLFIFRWDPAKSQMIPISKVGGVP